MLNLAAFTNFLPTVTSLNACQPPVMVLDTGAVVRLADLPRPLLIPEAVQGNAVLIGDYTTTKPACYHIPASLIDALRRVLNLQAVTA